MVKSSARRADDVPAAAAPEAGTNHEGRPGATGDWSNLRSAQIRLTTEGIAYLVIGLLAVLTVSGISGHGR